MEGDGGVRTRVGWKKAEIPSGHTVGYLESVERKVTGSMACKFTLLTCSYFFTPCHRQVVTALLDSVLHRAEECEIMEICAEAQAEALRQAPHSQQRGSGRERKALRWVRLARSTLSATQV